MRAGSRPNITIMSLLPNSVHPQTAQQPLSAPDASPEAASTVEEILTPLYEAALDSSSLVASRLPVEIRGEVTEIHKFLLLGQRGGGKPIRLGLFAGFETGQLENRARPFDAAASAQGEPRLSRDLRSSAIRWSNVRGFTAEAAPLSDFEARFARDSAEADVQFFKTELRKWRFDGLVSLRIDPSARGFYAAVRSEIIAAEVVEPALAAAASALPLATQAVKVRPGDRYARTADYAHGRLSPPADVRPYPFEIELYAPRGPITGERTDGLFVALTEILRLYPRLHRARAGSLNPLSGLVERWRSGVSLSGESEAIRPPLLSFGCAPLQAVILSWRRISDFCLSSSASSGITLGCRAWRRVRGQSENQRSFASSGRRPFFRRRRGAVAGRMRCLSANSPARFGSIGPAPWGRRRSS
ncbi:MAG: hypothetical protein WDN28_04680, partial [Chthoniobacter sp.]